MGGYLGYLWPFDDQGHVQPANSLAGYTGVLHLRTVRTGMLGSYRWQALRAFACGVDLEAGLLLGTRIGGDTVGMEVGPAFFFDFPLSSSPIRPYLTLSLGFRAGIFNHTANLPDDWDAVEVWYFFMPVVRLGLGIGR
jgi:hypothetical protein